MRRFGNMRWRGAASALALAALLALTGCGAAAPTAATQPTAPVAVSATAAATGTPAATARTGPCPNLVTGTATVPPAPAPTPLATANWTIYTNTAYHYALSYPTSWYTLDVSPTTNAFALLNYDPRTYRPNGDAVAPAPYSKIEIVVLQGTEGKSPAAYYASNDTPNPLGPPECSRTTAALTLAGHDALRIVQWPAASSYGPPTLYPAIHYYIATGAGRPLLAVSETYSPGGQPSPTLATIIASVTIAP
ncbi:MAG TPA: hypothetical protein VGR57_20805 [Ktedonobacterales bacterium]|nr:hypothetical protein [Ktedonobacterales bacterium]